MIGFLCGLVVAGSVIAWQMRPALPERPEYWPRARSGTPAGSGAPDESIDVAQIETALEEVQRRQMERVKALAELDFSAAEELLSPFDATEDPFPAGEMADGNEEAVETAESEATPDVQTDEAAEAGSRDEAMAILADLDQLLNEEIELLRLRQAAEETAAEAAAENTVALETETNGADRRAETAPVPADGETVEEPAAGMTAPNGGPDEANYGANSP